jgi:hypothetical protein
MEWAGLTFALRAIEFFRSAFQNPEAAKLEPDVKWSYDCSRSWFKFSLHLVNRLESPIEVRYLKLRKPVDGVVREDQSPPLIVLGGDIYGDTSQYGPAVRVLGLDLSIQPSREAWIEFAFVPPHGWSGGEFRADLEMAINRSRESKVLISLRRSISR